MTEQRSQTTPQRRKGPDIWLKSLGWLGAIGWLVMFAVLFLLD